MEKTSPLLQGHLTKHHKSPHAKKTSLLLSRYLTKYYRHSCHGEDLALSLIHVYQNRPLPRVMENNLPLLLRKTNRHHYMGRTVSLKESRLKSPHVLGRLRGRSHYHSTNLRLKTQKLKLSQAMSLRSSPSQKKKTFEDFYMIFCGKQNDTSPPTMASCLAE